MTEHKFVAQANQPNEILDCGDEFFISYNSGRESNAFDAILADIGKIAESNLGRPETALVISDSSQMFGRKHLILYGDYREAYSAVVDQGLPACVALFTKHIEHMTDTSDSLDTVLN